MTERTHRRGGLIHHRDFRLVWAGESISDVGTAVSTVVLPLIAVVDLHASTFQVGALAAAEWVPWLLIGLPAGVWFDRSRCRLRDLPARPAGLPAGAAVMPHT